MACQEGHVEVVHALIQAGAALDQAMNDGTTPLFIASGQGHLEVVRVLEVAGALK